MISPAIRHNQPGTDWAPFRSPANNLPREHTFNVMGLDLGQSVDHAAAAVLSKRVHTGNFCGPQDNRIKLANLWRWPNGTDYTDICAHCLSYPSLDALIVEYNGVGRPVVDTMRQMMRMAGDQGFRGRLIPVTSLNSRAKMHATVDEKGQTWSVPKIDLVSSLMLLIQSRRLAIPRKTRFLPNLIEEIRTFQMRYSKAANLQFGNEPGAGKHDDLVLGLSLSAWWITSAGKREPGVWMP